MSPVQGRVICRNLPLTGPLQRYYIFTGALNDDFLLIAVKLGCKLVGGDFRLSLSHLSVVPQKVGGSKLEVASFLAGCRQLVILQTTVLLNL